MERIFTDKNEFVIWNFDFVIYLLFGFWILDFYIATGRDTKKGS